jgi:spermidine/putrescine transport system substrate-binding protein
MKAGSNSQVSLDNYAAGYMWGTLGIIYDPYCSDTIQEDVKSWDVFWDSKYRDLISIKNSMRDTFVVGLMHGYKNGKFADVEGIDQNARETFLQELNEATSKEDLQLARNKYNNTIQKLFDLVIESDDYQKTIELVKNELISLKGNIFGLEVDSGKNDIVTGKIKMNLAWSGDAVYSIGVAMEEQDKVLEYYVPEDGSNVWYDGWVLPKKANRELACKFIDFLSEPSHAALNMEYIGYTSFIACDEVFDLVNSWYGNTNIKEFEFGKSYCGPVNADIVAYDNKYYRCINNNTGVLPTDTNYFEEVSKEELGVADPYDLGFIFDDKLEEGRHGVIYPYADCLNQLVAQYPDEDTIARCAVMNDFADRNDDVVIMWSRVKAYTNMVPYYVILSATVITAVSFFVVNGVKKHKSTRNKRKLEQLSVK